eukprot:GHVT01074964.1.p1 GENE.GHVT01074964.1~~GHVT01074964.1.p1  ORF type:complete len:267 (+),score=62.54 GHVT01074964.1:290-1090(+)
MPLCLPRLSGALVGTASLPEAARVAVLGPKHVRAPPEPARAKPKPKAKRGAKAASIIITAPPAVEQTEPPSKLAAPVAAGARSRSPSVSKEHKRSRSASRSMPPSAPVETTQRSRSPSRTPEIGKGASRTPSRSPAPPTPSRSPTPSSRQGDAEAEKDKAPIEDEEPAPGGKAWDDDDVSKTESPEIEPSPPSGDPSEQETPVDMQKSQQPDADLQPYSEDAQAEDEDDLPPYEETTPNVSQKRVRKKYQTLVEICFSIVEQLATR